MKGSHMKLNRFANTLINMQEQLETLKDSIEDKMVAIVERAEERDRGLTESEQERYDEYENQIYIIETTIDDIEVVINDMDDYID